MDTDTVVSTTTTDLPSGTLTITLTRPCPSVVVCDVAGEIDLMTAPQLSQQLMDAGVEECCDLVVDLSAVTFFAAAGARVLDDVQRARDGSGAHELVLVGASAQVRKVLDLCRACTRRSDAGTQARRAGAELVRTDAGAGW